MVMYKIDRRGGAGGGGQKSFSRKLPKNLSLGRTRRHKIDHYGGEIGNRL